jgi:hypothetical protein
MASTQQEMIEEIQMHFPDAGETYIRKLLNKALRKFVNKTQVLDGSDFTFNIVNGQRGYAFSDFSNITADDDVIEVTQVDLDGEEISKLAGKVVSPEDA